MFTTLVSWITSRTAHFIALSVASQKAKLMASILFVCVLSTVLTLIGCAASGGGSGAGFDGGGVGVTPGGTEDMAQARDEIEAGGVPDPESITVEGFLSEHDIPIPAPENPTAIFPSVAVAWRVPFGEDFPGVDVFFGLGSTIDLDSIERPDLNLAVVVDRSGSMDDPASYDDSRSKMEAVQQALHSMVDRLGSGDRVTLISFNDNARLLVEAESGQDDEQIRDHIDALRPGGGTDILEALEMAFESLNGSSTSTRADRVILFTDALPTSGASTSSEFLELLEDQADRGFGFTMMGVGIDFGTELAQEISAIRLGNSYYLSDEERIASIFEDDFDLLVTPAAYDLTLTLTIPDGMGIADVYGVPDYIPGSQGAQIVVPTLFFSRREGGGAIVIRLTLSESPTFETAVPLGAMSMDYTLADGSAQEMAMELMLPVGLAPTGDPAYFSDDGAKRAAVLLDTALAIKEACDSYHENRETCAVNLLDGFLGYFDDATQGMSDRTEPTSRGLSDERDLIETLLGTLRGRYSYYFGPTDCLGD